MHRAGAVEMVFWMEGYTRAGEGENVTAFGVEGRDWKFGVEGRDWKFGVMILSGWLRLHSLVAFPLPPQLGSRAQ